VFDTLIGSKELTPLESFDSSINGDWSRFTDGYNEVNNSWYIGSHNDSHGQTCKWDSFDDFMFNTFEDYHHLDWIRFTPGSQYIIPKETALHYPKEFWKYLMDILYKNNMTEGHILERALLLILQNKYTLC
jgi:hypothetical protein